MLEYIIYNYRQILSNINFYLIRGTTVISKQLGIVKIDKDRKSIGKLGKVDNSFSGFNKILIISAHYKNANSYKYFNANEYTNDENV